MPNYPSPDNYSDPFAWPDWREMDEPPPTEDDPWLDENGEDLSEKRRAGEAYVGPFPVGVRDADIPMTVDQTRRWEAGERP